MRQLQTALYFCMAISHFLAAIAFELQGGTTAAIIQAVGGIFWLFMPLVRDHINQSQN